jgi:hypothetical protein
MACCFVLGFVFLVFISPIAKPLRNPLQTALLAFEASQNGAVAADDLDFAAINGSCAATDCA